MKHAFSSVLFLLFLFISLSVGADKEVSGGADSTEPLVLNVLFGVRVRPMDFQTVENVYIHKKESGEGLQILEVQPDSPAAQAGIRKGDILLVINGKPIDTPLQLLLFLGRKQGGETIYPVLERNNKQVFCRVTLKARPQPQVVGHLKASALVHPHVTLRENLFRLQRQLAAYLAEPQRDTAAIQETIIAIRDLVHFPQDGPFKLWYQDGDDALSIVCYPDFSTECSDGTRTEYIRSPQDVLSEELRSLLKRCGNHK